MARLSTGCCCYHKGRNFQANHNKLEKILFPIQVVVATTKVGIFKQITTNSSVFFILFKLLLLPQRQEFSSKSQRKRAKTETAICCCCYHKGRNFQANHNTFENGGKTVSVVVATTKVGIFKQITTYKHIKKKEWYVVVATTKVGIFKQITTDEVDNSTVSVLLLLPQRQEFSSKSQQQTDSFTPITSCCCYHKGRNFQANHNRLGYR